jgi:hypothetical protein
MHAAGNTSNLNLHTGREEPISSAIIMNSTIQKQNGCTEDFSDLEALSWFVLTLLSLGVVSFQNVWASFWIAFEKLRW